MIWQLIFGGEMMNVFPAWGKTLLTAECQMRRALRVTDTGWKKSKGRSSSILPINPSKQVPQAHREELPEPKSHLAHQSACPWRKCKHPQHQEGWLEPKKEPSWGDACWRKDFFLLNFLPLLGEGQGCCKFWPRWHSCCAPAWAGWAGCHPSGPAWKWLKR